VTKRQPNFLIIGSAASGTSYLSEILSHISGLYLPPQMRPEPHFFYKSWEYSRGEGYYLKKWFSNVPDSAIAVGERSSSYLFGGTKVAERIHLHNSSMRLIAVLRNPIERAWANYRYTALEGLENLSFSEALIHEEERVANQKGRWAEIQPYNYTGRGYYARQISEFLRFIPRDQMLFIKSEDLSSRPEVEVRKVLDFLEVSSDMQEVPKASAHTSVDVINPAVQMLLRKTVGDTFDLLVEAARRNELNGFLASGPVSAADADVFVSNLKTGKSPMPEHSRLLLQENYSEDISKLKEYVDFDVSDWV